jgi:hemoglobin
MHSRTLILSAAVLVASIAPGSLQAQQPGAAATQTLYERLGGVYNIAAVADDFIERLYVNETLNANPAIAGARSQLRKPGLKVQLTTMMCQVTGGPCKYAGQGMKEAHAHFRITEGEWNAMVADFKATLDKFQVPASEQQELMTIVGSTKPDIVVGAQRSSAR